MSYREIDVAGDTAVALVEKNFGEKTVLWHSECSWTKGNDIKVVLRYHIRGNMNSDWETMEFGPFTVSEVISLLPDEARSSAFALINALRLRAQECESLKRRIGDTIKKEIVDPGNTPYEIDEKIRRFFFKEDFRKVAKYEALIWLTKKPRGWSDFVQTYTAS